MRTFAILTTSANGTIQQLHKRMPVSLRPAWLGEVGGDVPALMGPAADDVLNLWPVSRKVNSVRNNGADLLDRIDDSDAPPSSDAPAGDNPAYNRFSHVLGTVVARPPGANRPPTGHLSLQCYDVT
jgi:hypothetical protein